ncbi:hypothetical protein ALC62_14161 [Cyphomyrmex costatus]|uniref:Uncharacterized protein n=1 Tax=Cyphomyrmex costatus TaxID=456900 RepID=A0A195C3R4_9HYME|nr:hypothetical protein ALC62_14161 [Cyphomyrmex costatus]
MTQRVPSTGYYDNIIEDHSYTMFSMYPPTTNAVDWQLMKEENCMVRECWLSLARAVRTGHKTRGVILLKEGVRISRSSPHYIRNYARIPPPLPPLRCLHDRGLSGDLRRRAKSSRERAERGPSIAEAARPRARDHVATAR